MALSKDDILNAIAAMSVMEVVDLIKAMEEKFGVSAAAAVAAAPAAAAAAPAAEEQTEFECIAPALSGPSLLAFSMEDPGAAARIFKDFAKQVEAFQVKALAASGRLMGAEQIDVLASLPTRDQAISMLMSVMQAPVTKLVRTINEVPGKLVRTLAAIRDQKEAA